MLKPITSSLGDLRQAIDQPAAAPELVNNVFKVFHGFYGNLFLSKFANGQLNASGEDMGVISARQIWAHGLREFDLATVKNALLRCMEPHPEYPPTLPQFVALCKACAVRVVKPMTAAIDMGQPLRSRYARQAREITAKHAGRVIEKNTGYFAIEPGLSGLKQAIANAVATAGGDEMQELKRFDRMFPKVVLL